MEEDKEDKTEAQADEGTLQTSPNPNGFFPDLEDTAACTVAVAVRVRPLVGKELTAGSRKVCINDPVETHLRSKKLQMASKGFDFDAVFWHDDSQEDIFDKCTRNLVLGCFHGYNATILAYGQTGSGKTHTMGTGNSIGVPFDEVGIVPRVFKFIFDELDVRRAQSEYSEFKVRIAFMELYNEELHDLLDPASMVRDRVTGKPLKELMIREEKNVISVRGLKELEVSSQAECLHWLNSGINHRMTSATLMNEGSSRSHAIFTVTIEQKIVKDMDEGVEGMEKGADGEEKAQLTEEISSKFHFVDLAGSERIKKTGATGQLLKEGISINKGLLNLGLVISALTDEKKGTGHIPYRDSKLTRILQDSLGGNSRTTMIACVSPAESNYEESLGTIKYASRARNIKNKPIVNRDPNSLLIESLRNMITQLQTEVQEYIIFVKSSGLSLPTNLGEKAQQAIAAKKEQSAKNEERRKSLIQPVSSSGSANPAEVRDLKIKLSQRDKEIRELTQKLKDQQLVIDSKDKLYRDVEKEKDNIVLKSEAMAEKLKSNNIEFDAKDFEVKVPGQGQSQEVAQKSSLIDQYKAKLSKAQKDLDQKTKELSTLNQKFLAIKGAQDRNDKILKKHVDENQSLKKQLAAGGGAARAVGATGSENVLPVRKDFKTMRAQRKIEKEKQADEIESIFLADLEGQIDQLFTKRGFNADDVLQEELNKTWASSSGEPSNATQNLSITQENSADQVIPPQNDEAGAQPLAVYDKEAIEKEKVLQAVKQQNMQLQSNLKDLLKNEWAGAIKSLQGEKEKAETDRKTKLQSAKNDNKAIEAIEKQHQQKIENLNKQMAKQETEKKKKEENVAKQMAMQEARIKALEVDVQKKKLQKEEIEREKKYDENRFFKFKQEAGKNIMNEKKKISDKEKELQKVRNDLKKVDVMAQQKIAQLKGLQKRAIEEKKRKDEMEEKEHQQQGIDIDLIKAWIQFNTDAMLKNQELKEYLQKQVEQKDKIETEMLDEGDRMTDLLVMKEKLIAEKEEIEDKPENERDEGRLLEIEEELKDVALELTSNTETLDLLEGTLDFVQQRYNQILEEIEAFDMDSVQPMSFNALDSIESARATLKTFFQVVLDLNIYKRDLEAKCIDQDEQVIRLTADLQTQEARVQYMILHGGQDGYASQVAKQQAISNVVKQVDGFVDNRDVEHLHLNVQEQTNLTKLSLSKIVNNLKQKLQNTEVKNQQISLKLDQALKQKEIYRSKVDELKAQLKNASYGPSQARFAAQAAQQLEKKAPLPQVPTRQRGQSFRERQQQKQAPPKKIESLADRRKNRGQLIASDELGSDLTKLKADAKEILERDNKPGNNLLGDILEEEIPECDLEDEDEDYDPRHKRGANLFVGYGGVENGQNDPENSHNMSAQFTEEWVQENFVTLQTDSTMVDFFFLNSTMLCIFEDFQVQEIDLVSKQISKSYNLQEVQGFEISEEVEEDKVVAFALEKDVQLLGVVCVDTVHIFEYAEDNEENSLSHIACVPQANVTQIAFVDYHIVMERRIKGEQQVELLCYDPDGASIQGKLLVHIEEEKKLVIEPGNECIYVAAGTYLSKILIPTMSEIYKEDTKHHKDVIEMAVSQMNQIITTSNDGDMRFFFIETGEECAEAMQDMEVDHMETHGIYLISRHGKGESMLVWQLLPNGGVAENPLSEVTLQQINLQPLSDIFKMKGGVSAKSEQNDGRETEGLIMMQGYQNHYEFGLLTQKLSKQ